MSYRQSYLLSIAVSEVIVNTNYRLRVVKDGVLPYGDFDVFFETDGVDFRIFSVFKVCSYCFVITMARRVGNLEGAVSGCLSGRYPLVRER